VKARTDLELSGEGCGTNPVRSSTEALPASASCHNATPTFRSTASLERFWNPVHMVRRPCDAGHHRPAICSPYRSLRTNESLRDNSLRRAAAVAMSAFRKIAASLWSVRRGVVSPSPSNSDSVGPTSSASPKNPTAKAGEVLDLHQNTVDQLPPKSSSDSNAKGNP
jgi:hypothetical protein